METKIKIIKGNYDGNNAFIISKNETAIIVDAGATLKAIIDGLESLSLTNQNVKGILITHRHFDHITNIADYMKTFNCPIFASVLTHPNIIKSKNFKAIINEDEFEIDNIKIKPIISPGHSEDCICFLIDGNLITGDVLFNSDIGNIFQENGKLPYLETLKKLSHIKFQTAYHGHDYNGNTSTYKEQSANIIKHINWLEGEI
jgi:glyoxylase-like metal-dependent hydrolase (beta-lactamase superfamily II)